VKKFTRSSYVVHAVASPDTPLLLDHKLTGSRYLRFKRAQLVQTHHIAVHYAGGAPDR